MTTRYAATFNVVTDDPTTAYARANVTVDTRCPVIRGNWHPTMSDDVAVLSLEFWSANDNEAQAIMREAMSSTGVPADTLRIVAKNGTRNRDLT